ncbi:N-acetylmuramoyl-L-alanine amidase [Paraflavitalea sp. CAU 1676]|uniref:N-acetylmuramoyl-L-alanine amidase n=1 Tax=Paraflavitalea sp. CAU 1676 TaxID=3032598 RepID=UPI0023DC230D|nr:N-acetylmuramoyl-L-alanine amidase [Paraflavitalea sp. CAU 1676]MDF2187026.1 N-acetylmuramoyl-L-alanine amidase [Paraflavitalea sp. CAU 1676]
MRLFARLLPVVAICLSLAAGVNSCSPNPYAQTNKSYKKQSRNLAGGLQPLPVPMTLDSTLSPKYAVGTVNFDLRKPNFVIIHHTAQNSCEQTLKTFTLERTKVSAHYVICKDGTIHHMLNDYLRAWQAGISKWGNNTDINSSSIGIELDNNGFESFAEPQMVSLLRLLDTLKRKYAIPTGNFIGHSDIAPKRKVDPNVTFPWQRLAQRGFGNWYDDTTNVVIPPSFDHLLALRLVGYDLADTTAAIRAFKRKYLQDTLSRTLAEPDEKILYQLMRKSQ